MKKEKTIKAYKRRTKTGKVVSVRGYNAKYDAADELKNSIAKKEGAGEELRNRMETYFGFSKDDYKQWYHWDMVDDPDNQAALRAKNGLIKLMGKSAYAKYEDEQTGNYSSRGHIKSFKAINEKYVFNAINKEKPSRKTSKEEPAWESEDRVYIRKKVMKGEYTPVVLQKAYAIGDKDIASAVEKGITEFMYKGVAAIPEKEEKMKIIDKTIDHCKEDLKWAKHYLKKNIAGGKYPVGTAESNQFVLDVLKKIRKEVEYNKI